MQNTNTECRSSPNTTQFTAAFSTWLIFNWEQMTSLKFVHHFHKQNQIPRQDLCFCSLRRRRRRRKRRIGQSLRWSILAQWMNPGIRKRPELILRTWCFHQQKLEIVFWSAEAWAQLQLISPGLQRWASSFLEIFLTFRFDFDSVPAPCDNHACDDCNDTSAGCRSLQRSVRPSRVGSQET